VSLKRSKLLSAAAIILICTIGCAGLSCILSWGRQIVSQEPPDRLPPPPAEAEEILGIETERFFEAVPVVGTSDRMVYRYVRSAGDPAWEAASQPGATDDDPCGEAHRQALTEAAGRLADCREVQPPGEWCPAPIFAYAVGSDGSVWQLRDEQPCVFATVVAFVVLGLMGSVVGLGIAVTRLLVLRWRKA
jgi:hypothetical protein